MFKFKIEGDKVEDLLTLTKGTPNKQGTELTCPICGDKNQNIDATNLSWLATDGLTRYPYKQITCNQCGYSYNVGV